MKKLVCLLLLVPLLGGCLTWDMKHNRRHFRKFYEDLHDLHEDIDRVVFGLEPHPGE